MLRGRHLYGASELLQCNGIRSSPASPILHAIRTKGIPHPSKLWKRQQLVDFCSIIGLKITFIESVIIMRPRLFWTICLLFCNASLFWTQICCEATESTDPEFYGDMNKTFSGELGEEGEEEEERPVPKHISWLAGGTPSNYSTMCDETTAADDLYHCFSEWDKSTVSFYLFNRGRNGSEILKLGDVDQLKKSTFRRRAPVKIIIHGYKQTAFTPFAHLIREAYLKHGNETNVIVVDWRWLAAHSLYFHSAFNTRIVGERVGEFIVYLRKTRFIRSYKMVHLVGFSLGAHVAGFAAKHVKKTARIRVARVTGLDPAGPAFSGTKRANRLDSTDAQFVDVIHTCVGRSGIIESIGHVDFYPNGGEDQPGCEWERLHSFFLKNCSHERAFEFYLESIKGEKFIGCHCPKWEDFQTGNCRCSEQTAGAELMGETCSIMARGNKYLATTYDNHYISI